MEIIRHAQYEIDFISMMAYFIMQMSAVVSLQ